MPRKLNSSWIPLPLNYNGKLAKYEVIEGGVKYTMDLEHTRLLKEYFYGNRTGSIKEWFNKLDRALKKQVSREGQISQSDSDFYPDREYE